VLNWRGMELTSLIAQGLLSWVLFIPLLTFHEFAHAWTAWKCGDDTAYLQGRVSLNPIVHMEVIGTVVLPLIAIFASLTGSALAGFIIGWGRPVPVNLRNLSNPKLQDSLIAMAGPAMNLLLAALLFGLVKIGILTNQEGLIEIARRMILVSLILCFFNLIPVPPLDGSHILLHVTGMSYETYFRLAQAGMIIIIVLLQLPFVRLALNFVTMATYYLFAHMWGLGGG
jgi:Zn-dependent protease